MSDVQILTVYIPHLESKLESAMPPLTSTRYLHNLHIPHVMWQECGKLSRVYSTCVASTVVIRSSYSQGLALCACPPEPVLTSPRSVLCHQSTRIDIY